MPGQEPREHVVLAGGAVPANGPAPDAFAVDDEAALAAAVGRAVAGEAVVVRAADAMLDPLVAELRRLGPVRVVRDDEVRLEQAGPTLDDDGRALLLLLGEGLTLGEAAARLHLSTRTANRRVAGAREALGVRTTVEAVAALTSAAAAPRRPLVGRDEVLVRLTELLAADAAVLLVGEGGVGKSALLDAVRARDGRPAHVAAALESRRLVDHDVLRRALHDDALTGDPEAVAAAVARIVGPQLLVLDDVHVADASTRQALSLLPGHVAVLAAARDAGDVPTVLAEAGFVIVHVDPLDAVDVLALSQQLAPGMQAVERARLVEESAGLPMLVEFLCGDVDAVTGRGIAPAVAALDPEAFRTALLLAVSSSPRPTDASTDALLRAGLASRDVDGRVVIRHGLVADAVLARADAAQLREAHLRLSREVDDPAEAASHLAHAGERAAATRLALEAWEAAATPTDAARLLSLAAESSDDGEAPALRVRAAEALTALGRAEEADRLVDAVLEDGEVDALLRARALLVRTRALSTAGDLDAAARCTVEGETLARGRDDNLAGRLRVEWAWCDLVRHAGLLTDDHLEETETLLGQGPGLGQLHNVRGIARYSARDGGLAEYRAGREAALAEGDVDAYLRCSNNIVMTVESSGSQHEGYALALEMADECTDRGLGEWHGQFLAMAANLAMHRGDYAEALRLTEQVRSLPCASITRRQVTGTRASMLADLGLFDEALELAAELGGTDVQAELDVLMYIRAWHLLTTGRAQEAREAVVVEADPDRTVMIFSLPLLAWAEHELGLPVSAPVVDEEGLVPLSAGPVAEVRAVARLADDPREAALLFDRAGALMADRMHFPWLRARWGGAEARRLAGDDVTRDLLLLESEATASGLEPLLALVRRSLRLAGVPRPAARGMDRSGLLTAREREVLDLVARGETYAEIARRLGLGGPTVRRLADNARRRTGATTVVAAAAQVAAASPSHRP